MPATTKRSRSRTGAEKKPRPATEKASSEDRLATYRAKRDFEVTPEPRIVASRGPRGKENGGCLPRVSPSPSSSRSTTRGACTTTCASKSTARWSAGPCPRARASTPPCGGWRCRPRITRWRTTPSRGASPTANTARGTCSSGTAGPTRPCPPGSSGRCSTRGTFTFASSARSSSATGTSSDTGRKPGDDGAGNAGKAQWLLFKAKDARANAAYDVVAERPESVVSGKAATRGPLRVGASDTGKSARALIEFVGEPALATADVKITRGDDWLFEIKYDGYRLVACKAGADVRLYTRRAHDWTERFRAVAESVAQAPGARVRDRRRGVRPRRAGAPVVRRRCRTGSPRSRSASRRRPTSFTPSSTSCGSTGGTCDASPSRSGASCSRGLSAGRSPR